ncbi:hypothetical protein [Kitasatospora paranensis]|uniref:hypothetical protein n=1 Tax=Kitasatospora paranensis TaxID=258053 RepID=UPI0031EC132B
MIQDDVFLHLGDAARNIDLYLKIEGLNPAGSIKLKTARSMVEDAERRGPCAPDAVSSSRRPAVSVSPWR